jgi:dTDP-4-amino-4,6-dideoxygalactose transaminase
VDAASYLIDLERIEAAITPATRVLLPVHLFGQPVDMERIGENASRHGLNPLQLFQQRHQGRHEGP